MMRYKLLLILLPLCLTLCFFAACNDTNDSTEETTEEITSIVETSETTDEAMSETAVSDTSFPVASVTPSKYLLYEEGVVSNDAYIQLPTDALYTGTLLHIDSGFPYRYDLSTLVPNNSISSSLLEIRGQSLRIVYGNKSQNYVLSNSKLFMKTDVFPHWEALVAAFRQASDKSSLQMVNAYLYSNEKAIESPFITGYCVAVNLYENGATYSLASHDKSITVEGETMTCLEWFIDHCAEYGFVYTGLAGSESQALATFRYVGIPHSLTMRFYDVIDMKIYSDFIRTTSPAVETTDPSTGITWKIKYFAASQEENHATTVIPLPIGAVYTISGDNMGGFIVAYYVPGGFETGA